MTKTDKIMEQVGEFAIIYSDIKENSIESKNIELIGAVVENLRAMIEDMIEVPDGWQLVPIICTPEIESVYSNDTGAYQTAQELHDAMLSISPKYDVKPMKVNIPVDCRQCEQFDCERVVCAATHSCTNGSQYEPSIVVQLFRKE
jgi:hypothetical protein